MKAILYGAKSTADPKGSIETQLADSTALAEQEGMEVVASYSDEAASAYKQSRGDGLAQAKEHAASIAAVEGECALIVQHTDRLARGDAIQAAHLVEVALWAMKAGVRIRSVQDDSTGENLLMAVVMGQRNFEDSKRKALSVKSGMERSAKLGKAQGGPAPYGYRYSGDKNDPGRLIVIPEEAAIVRRIFSEYIAGRPQCAIAKALHDEGVPTKQGRIWGQGMIARILRNPLYIGQIRLAGNTYPGNHDTIIDEAMFQKAQSLMRVRASHTQGRTPTGMHLFRKGMLRCGRCDSALSPRNDGKRETYYCVGRRQLGADHCSMPSVRRELIDVAVYDYFEKAALDVEGTRQQLEGVRNDRLVETHSLINAATRAERESSEALVRVKRDYTRGAISAEDWNELRIELEAEHAGSVGELERLRDQLRAIEQWSPIDDAQSDALQRLAQIRTAIAGEVKDAAGVASVRSALQRLFESFIVHVDGDQGRIDPVVRNEAWTSVAHETQSGDLIPVPVLRPTRLELPRERNGDVGLTM